MLFSKYPVQMGPMIAKVQYLVFFLKLLLFFLSKILKKILLASSVESEWDNWKNKNKDKTVK